MKSKGLLLGAAWAVPSLFFGLLFSVLLFQPAPAAANCELGESTVSTSDLPKVSGYSTEQLKNAAAIINSGKALNLSVKGQMISVMVALGESGLRVLDIGDGAGP